MKSYIRPNIEIVVVPAVLCSGSSLDIHVSGESEEDGYADGNGRRGHWGNLWNNGEE